MSIHTEIAGIGSQQCALVRDSAGAQLCIDGVQHRVQLQERADGRQEIVLDGARYPVRVIQRGDRALVHAFGRAWSVLLHDAVAGDGVAAEAGDACVAPLNGTVVEVRVAVGDSVAAGQVLMVIESMKMQMNLEAQRDGVVSEINAAAGEVFDRDAALIRLAPQED